MRHNIWMDPKPAAANVRSHVQMTRALKYFGNEPIST